MIGGWQRGKLYVVAGRPAMGKSALGGNAALEAAMLRRRGAPSYPSLTINLEMGPEEIMERHIWSEVRKIPHAPGLHERARAGRMSETDFRALVQAADRVHRTGMAIIDGVGMTSQDIAAKARRWRNSKDCGKGQDGLIIVDYLQLIRPPRGKSSYNREQEVAAISREMKILAKDLHMPVLLLCQLNRGVEKREDHRPRMDDLRESGAIEQDADVIIFVHRPCQYIPDKESPEYLGCKDDAEIIVAKQRGGETGLIRCKYYGPYLAFENQPGEIDESEE
jgi:replicative DNA helicase